jgi:mannitol/fructose-specific phosphotransferase system IIA component (Ntr-type)
MTQILKPIFHLDSRFSGKSAQNCAGINRYLSAMDLNEFFGPKPIVVDLRAENRWDAIDELLGHLVEHQKIKPEDKSAIGEAIKKRERSVTTAIGFGIAIPHASTALASEVVGIIGRSRQGV